jgi:hypothetical protein
VPLAPKVGERLVMLGDGTTVKLAPLLFTPLALTITLPVVAPVGTVATTDVAPQLVIVAVVLPNVTVPLPCVEPKLVPVIVTEAPTAPVVGDRLVMLGAGTTVKLAGLLVTPLAFTVTLPVDAPAGTVATIDVAVQLVMLAVVFMNFTVPLLCVEPKLVPVIVTEAPTAPVVGERLVMVGARTTVKDAPLLFTPLAFTTTLPVVAPAGTVATIAPGPQLVIVVAAVPLNITKPVPWVEPKLDPAIVTDAPTAPDVGETLVIVGVGSTVKLTPLLAFPPTVTATLPFVAPVGTAATIDVVLQLVIVVAVVPLNFTVFVPWEPKFNPVIVTDAPTTAEVGESVLILG